MDIKALVEGLHPLEIKVVPFLKDVKSLSELVKKSGLQEVEAMRALQWLENKKILNIKAEDKETIELDINGKDYVKNGLPEKRFLKALKLGAKTMKDLLKVLSKEEFGISIGLLKQKIAIKMEKGELTLTKDGEKLLFKPSLEEEFLIKVSKGAIDISTLAQEEVFALKNLLRRKRIIQKKVTKLKYIELTDLGKKLTQQKLTGENYLGSLTPEIIKSGKWQKQKFRAYDVQINVPEISSGKRHFMQQAISYMKKIWLEMGFEEMSGNFVQTSYWDLDSLFVPQDHPARAMQDTFYVADPKGKLLLGKLPKDFKTVKKVHETGGSTGSKGWGGTWDENLAREVLLRTHGTVLSSKQLHKLDIADLPKKYFAISRVFRNEAMDWKHLFEFEQVEGIVVDENVNFRHLLGYLKQFFRKLGFAEVRLRPAHFPYTEPSVEVEVFNPVKKEWVELGGAGIFRPEVTKTLIGKEVPVLAWGLGLARIAAEYWSIQDIRETYKNDLTYLRNLKLLMK